MDAAVRPYFSTRSAAGLCLVDGLSDEWKEFYSCFLMQFGFA